MLWAGFSTYNGETLRNVVQLFAFAANEGLPVRVTWSIMGAVYDPPRPTASQTRYYAPQRNLTARWGTPFGSQADPDYQISSTKAQIFWPGEADIGLVFAANGDCLTPHYQLLGPGSPWSRGRSMATLGGVECLWATRQYKISQDPAKGAAWCIRRTMEIDNNNGYLDSIVADQWDETLYYYFCTGYAAGDTVATETPNRIILDSISQETGKFPFTVQGGPPSGFRGEL
jgi:hypothetical protein